MMSSVLFCSLTIVCAAVSLPSPPLLGLNLKVPEHQSTSFLHVQHTSFHTRGVCSRFNSHVGEVYGGDTAKLMGRSWPSVGVEFKKQRL